MGAIVSALICILALSGPAPAQQQVSAKSQAKLEGVFSKVLDRLWETNDRYWHTGQFERSIAVLRLITQISPDDVQAYSDGAWMMENQDRDGDAEAFLLEGIRNNPESPDMLFELGHFYYMHERFDEAIRYLQSVLLREPHWRTWHLLAHAHEHTGNVEEALSIWFRMLSEEDDPAVPQIQIDRILSGGPPTRVLGMQHPVR